MFAESLTAEERHVRKLRALREYVFTQGQFPIWLAAAMYVALAAICMGVAPQLFPGVKAYYVLIGKPHSHQVKAPFKTVEINVILKVFIFEVKRCAARLDVYKLSVDQLEQVHCRLTSTVAKASSLPDACDARSTHLVILMSEPFPHSWLTTLSSWTHKTPFHAAYIVAPALGFCNAYVRLCPCKPLTGLYS